MSNKYGNQNNVHDLFQEGYIALVNASKHFDSDIGNFENFAMICVRNKMIDILRGKRSLTGLVEVEDAPETQIWECLPDMSKDEERIVNLMLEGYSREKISEMTNFTKYKINKTIKVLKKKIQHGS